MNKKLIRLTESDLHRIVKESVNNVLNELDWKTYQNAALKSWERADDNFHNELQYINDTDRTEEFAKAAERSFNKQYPREKGRLIHPNYGHPAATYENPYSDLNFIGHGDRDAITLKQYRKLHGGRTLKGNQDAIDYALGNTKYEKGKGWQKH